MVQRIPKGLNIAQFVKQNPPKINGFKIDKMVYILNLIYSIPANNKDMHCYDGYIPINSKILKKKVHNYKSYLEYLCRNNILETDNFYIMNQKSKGYRFCENYRNNGIANYSIKDRMLIRNITKSRREKMETAKKLKYITKYMDKKLQIDYKAAKEYAEEDYRLKTKHPELRDVDEKNGKYKDPHTQYNANILNIERLKNFDYYMSVDQKVQRLHTNLTCLKSTLRNFITYDGQQLVSIDIKNSQPYLSMILFNENFWKTKKTKNPVEAAGLENITCINKVPATVPTLPIAISISNVSMMCVSKIIYKLITSDTSYINTLIMCLKSVNLPINTDVSAFCNLVSKGKLYEEISKRIKMELNIEITDRKKLKEIIFQVMFTDNRFIGQTEAAPKRIFKKLFPNVYELFKCIKKKESTLLPLILQSIESHLILKVIAKRISIERPDLPIFTIHDSIATTVGNEDYVSSVMMEELTKAIGIAPTLSPEYWKPENVKHKVVTKKIAA